MARHAAFIGLVDLEATLVWPVLTFSTVDVPTNADSAPTYDIRSADMSTSLTTGTTTNLETGIYYGSKAITAAAGFASGQTYAILVTFALSASSRKQTYTFTVS